MSDKPKTNIVPLPARTGKMLTHADVQSSNLWLETWGPAEPLPDGATEQLPALVEAAERAIAPADVKAFAVAMDALVQWVEVFGVIPLPADQDKREAQIGAIVAGYRTTLADLPADVLAKAVRATIANHQFRTLPMPADIRKYAEAELRERQARMLRLKTAQQIAERQAKASADYAFPRERTPEQIAAAAGMTAAVYRIDAAPKTMPTDISDHRAEDNDRRAAIQRVQEQTRGFRRISKPWEKPQ